MTTKSKMTTEERIRRNKARATVAAQKRLTGLDIVQGFAAIVDDYVLNCGRQEGKARVMAMVMRERFEPGWQRFLEAEPSGDNETATRKGILEARKLMRDKAIERGLANVNKPWSDMLKVTRELDNPFGETREPKPVAARVRETAKALYVKIGKMEAPDDKLMEAQRLFAKVLVLYGMDLAAINAKL